MKTEELTAPVKEHATQVIGSYLVGIADARTQETRNLIRDVRRVTRRKLTAEEKIRIVLEGFRPDTPIRDL